MMEKGAIWKRTHICVYRYRSHGNNIARHDRKKIFLFTLASRGTASKIVCASASGVISAVTCTISGGNPSGNHLRARNKQSRSCCFEDDNTKLSVNELLRKMCHGQSTCRTCAGSTAPYSVTRLCNRYFSRIASSSSSLAPSPPIKTARAGPEHATNGIALATRSISCDEPASR